MMIPPILYIFGADGVIEYARHAAVSGELSAIDAVEWAANIVKDVTESFEGDLDDMEEQRDIAQDELDDIKTDFREHQMSLTLLADKIANRFVKPDDDWKEIIKQLRELCIPFDKEP
jgi:carboxylesterase type B